MLSVGLLKSYKSKGGWDLMCFGGGGGARFRCRTGAYDAMANAQIGAMQSAMSMGIQQTQNTLNRH